MAAVVLPPRHLLGVAGEVGARYVVVMAEFGAAHAAEAAFRLVGAGVIVGIFDGVIDAPGVEVRMQLVPGGGFVCVDRRGAVEAGLDEAHCGVFACDNRGERPSWYGAICWAFTNHHHALALIAAVLSQAQILAVSLTVLRPDVTAEIGAIDLSVAASAADAHAFHLRSHRLADLVCQHEGCLVLDAKIARQRQGALAFDFVAEDGDGSEIVADRQLVVGEQGAAGWREVLTAGFAAEPGRSAGPAAFPA